MKLLHIFLLVSSLSIYQIFSYEQRFLFGYPNYNTLNTINSFPAQQEAMAMGILSNLKFSPLSSLLNPLSGYHRSLLPIQPRSFHIPFGSFQQPQTSQNSTKKANSTSTSSYKSKSYNGY